MASTSPGFNEREERGEQGELDGRWRERGRRGRTNHRVQFAPEDAAYEPEARGFAGFCEASAEVHDDHAAIRVVLFGLRRTSPSRVAIERELEAGLVLLPPLALLFLALPNLLDDERRKHQVLPLHSRRACLLSFCAPVDTPVTLRARIGNNENDE